MLSNYSLFVFWRLSLPRELRVPGLCPGVSLLPLTIRCLGYLLPNNAKLWLASLWAMPFTKCSVRFLSGLFCFSPVLVDLGLPRSFTLCENRLTLVCRAGRAADSDTDPDGTRIDLHVYLPPFLLENEYILRRGFLGWYH